MSVFSPTDASQTWQAGQVDAIVPMFLQEAQGDSAALVGNKLAGFSIGLKLVSAVGDIEADEIAAAPVALVEVDQQVEESIERFRSLAKLGVPLIAGIEDPPLKLVRELILAGAHDVIPLPLDAAELERSLIPIRERVEKKQSESLVRNDKVVAVLKSVGGVGGTSLLAQTAIRFCEHARAAEREACLLDLDVQFGDAAFQMGLRPKLSLQNLIEAGTRLDPALLRSHTTRHPSGLHVIAAPPEMMPLESFSSESVLSIVDLCAREFGTVFVDLPTNWTNWSLSVIARADIVLMITEASVSCLHRARRQLELLKDQDLVGLDVRIVVNRTEKKMLKSVRLADVEKALGREVSFTIANDHPTMRSAIDRGIPISEVRSRSPLVHDIDMMAEGITDALGLER